MNHSRHTLTGIVVVLGIVASVALAGCSFGGSGGGSSDGTSTNSGGTDTSTGTSADGTDNGLSGYEGKPDTFPADVPIIDGTVLFGVDLGTGWSIVVEASDIDAAYTEATGKLTGAGYTSDVSSTSEDGSFGSFTGEKYTVQVTATDSSDYGPSVQYVVIKNG